MTTPEDNNSSVQEPVDGPVLTQSEPTTVQTTDPQIQAIMEGMVNWAADGLQQLDIMAKAIRNDPNKLELFKENPDDPEKPIRLEVTQDMANCMVMGLLAGRKLLETFPLKFTREEIQSEDGVANEAVPAETA